MSTQLQEDWEYQKEELVRAIDGLLYILNKFDAKENTAGIIADTDRIRITLARAAVARAKQPSSR